MNTVNFKAILAGTAVFAGLYAVHVLILPLLKNSLEMGEGGGMFFVSQMLGVATCFASGHVAARIAGERGFFYGFNVAALGTVLSALAAAAFALAAGAALPGAGLRTLPYWIFVNGSLGGFAGLLASNMVEEGRRER